MSRIYLDSGYLNVHELLARSLPFNFAVGGRGTGKTYGSLCECLDTHRQFLLIRRTQAQADIITRPEFSPFKRICYDRNLQITCSSVTKYTYNLTNTSALMKQLKSNDLNPTLALGSGGTGGQTVSTGNSGTQGVGMIDNKISSAEAMQMSLLEAQKKNIEADTKLKEADANKTSGAYLNTRTSSNDTSYTLHARWRTGCSNYNAAISKNARGRCVGIAILHVDGLNLSGSHGVVVSS